MQLKDAQMISLLNSMKRLRDIEGRGNVKVDRQSGRVTPVRPIEFLPEAPPKEKGPFKVTWICSFLFSQMSPDWIPVAISTLETDDLCNSLGEIRNGI